MLLAIFLIIGNKAQAQCNGSNSPTFQITTSTATPAINGFCGTQINIMNANTTPPGGALSYSLMAPGQSSIIIGPTPTIATVAGIWTVVVMDLTNSCVTIKTVQVNVLPAPNVAIVANNTIVCSGDLTTLTASGANSYIWNTSATTTSVSVTPTSTLIFSVMGTGSNGCSNSASVVINVNPLPNITVSVNQNSVCVNEPITFTASGANTYTWSTLQTEASITVTPAMTTNYTVFATDGQGCESNSQILVSVSPCTSIGEFKIGNEELKIYPIPAKDYCELRFENENMAQDFKTLTITNNLGLLIKEEISFKDKVIKIRTEDLSDGSYFISISNAQNEKLIRKLLIAK